MDAGQAAPEAPVNADCGVFQHHRAQSRSNAVLKKTATARATLAGAQPNIVPAQQCNTPFPRDFARFCQAALPAGSGGATALAS